MADGMLMVAPFSVIQVLVESVGMRVLDAHGGTCGEAGKGRLLCPVVVSVDSGLAVGSVAGVDLALRVILVTLTE